MKFRVHFFSVCLSELRASHDVVAIGVRLVPERSEFSSVLATKTSRLYGWLLGSLGWG